MTCIQKKIPQKIKICFLYSDYNNLYKCHKTRLFSKKASILTLDYQEKNIETMEETLLHNHNWKMILSASQCWLWKKELGEIVEISKDCIEFVPSFSKIKKMEEIIRKNFENPYSVEEILNFLGNFDSFRESFLKSGEKEFYLAHFVQNIIS